MPVFCWLHLAQQGWGGVLHDHGRLPVWFYDAKRNQSSRDPELSFPKSPSHLQMDSLVVVGGRHFSGQSLLARA